MFRSSTADRERLLRRAGLDADELDHAQRVVRALLDAFDADDAATSATHPSSG